MFLTTDLVTMDHVSHHRFSHDGRFLAVGSEEGCVDFYDLSKGSSLHRADYCKGITGFVAAVDFSVDDKYIRVSIGRPNIAPPKYLTYSQLLMFTQTEHRII